ncbi:hypothetical protein NpPPO83_00011857 [Neofusicoccum parvum]|uniref:Uncharacterized protein n=1 Tax=Neofusicoccum parvum TaxID=310453 RepID=A0ACB5SJI0_9PEZI|nr:hypothetical protein NpPPO83_00011857 [Neofusicoccum parvum]
MIPTTLSKAVLSLRLLMVPAALAALWQLRALAPVGALVGASPTTRVLDGACWLAVFLPTAPLIANLAQADVPVEPAAAARHSACVMVVLVAGLALAAGARSSGLAWVVVVLCWGQAGVLLPASQLRACAAWAVRCAAAGCLLGVVQRLRRADVQPE